MWAKNTTGISAGEFRTVNGNADELIAIGRCIKAGFACSKVEITNGRYDAVIDLGHGGQLIRVQIKGTSNGILGLEGGGRSGQQINRAVAQRTYIYSKKDCDLILGLDSNNGDCYIIPIEDIVHMGRSKKLANLLDYKENWDILRKMAVSSSPDTDIVSTEREE